MAVEEAAFQDFVEGGKILVVCRLSSQSGMMTLAKKKEEKSGKKKNQELASGSFFSSRFIS